MSDQITPRQRKLQRQQALWTERTSWVQHWREISEYQQPRAGRFLVTDRNKGEKRHNAIYDRTPIGAQRTLSAGLMSGMTSPARPWFRLTLSDPELRELGPVKTWLHRSSSLLREIFNVSNTYRALQQGYGELGLFGTWANVVLPDFDNVIHHYPLTIGEFAIATNAKGIVDTLAREYQMTVGQMVDQFGIERVSSNVKNLYDRHQLDQWITVMHLVEPNQGRDPRKADNKNMRWASTYIDLNDTRNDAFLSESGFKRFPVLAPRWEVTGGDIYGSSPGMEALGDVKQLQHAQLRSAQAIDYKVNPPLQAPIEYKENNRARLPGGMMYVANTGQGTGIRSAFEVNLDMSHHLENIQDIRNRINDAYYAPLFMMLANDTRSGVTATEIAERHEEKLLMLGPVLERLHNELLSPLIDITFDYASEAGILPPVPEELAGRELNVEFVSTLAQAQRIVAAQGADRLIATVGSIAQLNPQVIDKVNWDQVVDDYAENYGVNPEIIVPDDQVAEIRAQRAQAQQAQMAAAAAPQMVDSAKTASEIDTSNLRDVMQGLTGYSTPAGV